jgi:hypothetical protein
MRNKFSQYQSRLWTIEYPQDWIVEEHSECFSFYAENGVGALQISNYSKDETVTVEDLKEFTENEVPEDDEIKNVTVGNCSGLGAEFQYKDHFWRMWFLAKGKNFFYITYNCEFEDHDVEKEVVNQIIDTFKCIDQE